MQNQIQELVPGQAPSLLNAEKGNELIKAINSLRNSRGVNGIDVKIDTTGELVISQPHLQAAGYSFFFAGGGSWTAIAEHILPVQMDSAPWQWYVEFEVGDDGLVNPSAHDGAQWPVDIGNDNDIFGGGSLDGLFNGSNGNDQTFTRVPIIINGRVVNPGGVFKEVTVCHDGNPIQQFIRT